MALRPGDEEPWLGAGTGGVSGPAIHAIALAQVNEVAARVSIPVVGMGGCAVDATPTTCSRPVPHSGGGH